MTREKGESIVRIALRLKDGGPRAVAAQVLLLVLACGVAFGEVMHGQTRTEAAGGGPPSVSATGIPYGQDDDRGPAGMAVADAIRARRAGGQLLNLDRMLLHSPTFAEGWNTMFGVIRGQLSLPPKLRELAIMFIGVLNQAPYEWGQHERVFVEVGGTPEQMTAMRNPDAALADTEHFDEAERATLALTYEMTRNVVVTDETLRRVRDLLPEAELIELIGTIAGYNMVSRFVVATGLEME